MHAFTSSCSDCPAFQFWGVWQKLVSPEQPQKNQQIHLNRLLRNAGHISCSVWIRPKVWPDEAGSVRIKSSQLSVIKGKHSRRVKVPENSKEVDPSNINLDAGLLFQSSITFQRVCNRGLTVRRQKISSSLEISKSWQCYCKWFCSSSRVLLSRGGLYVP